MRLRKYLSALLIFIISACSSLTLKPADYSWPIENVLKVDNKGFVEEQRYSFTLKVKALFYEEFKDSTNFSGKEIRLIRDKVGFYYITGKDFKNVYVFESEENGMDLENKILITETGLTSPMFNQKSPNIELLDNSNKYLLNNEGIVR
ncbi:MAG: hypothetical protein FIA82_01555 [Melioribacter sp.]|nr:hypothetical protein [Melioribacter sp.]